MSTNTNKFTPENFLMTVIVKRMKFDDIYEGGDKV